MTALLALAASGHMAPATAHFLGWVIVSVIVSVALIGLLRLLGLK